MARTHLLLKEIRAPYNATNSETIKTKMDDFDDTLDSLVLGSAGFLTADAAGRAVMAAGYFNEATVDDKVAAGAIDGDRLKAGALSADATGRALMASSYFNEATATAKFAAGAIDASLIKSATLDGTQVKVVADANVIGGLYVMHRIDVADGATGDVDVTLTHKTRVFDVVVIKTAGAGGASDTITVKNGANAITNAMDINVADKTVVRPTTIDDAQWEIAASGTLRVTRTKASAANVACTVYVRGIRVA